MHYPGCVDVAVRPLDVFAADRFRPHAQPVAQGAGGVVRGVAFAFGALDVSGHSNDGREDRSGWGQCRCNNWVKHRAGIEANTVMVLGQIRCWLREKA